MGQEFIIKSQNLEDKINQLLPSQGGFQAGVDLSASTQIIPIVDLTETAEGSLLRQDLQTSLSLTTATAFFVSNTTSTLINTTGYYRVFGNYFAGTVAGNAQFNLTDGTTVKNVLYFNAQGLQQQQIFDFSIFLRAGESLTASTNAATITLQGTTRQIA